MLVFLQNSSALVLFCLLHNCLFCFSEFSLQVNLTITFMSPMLATIFFFCSLSFVCVVVKSWSNTEKRCHSFHHVPSHPLPLPVLSPSSPLLLHHLLLPFTLPCRVIVRFTCIVLCRLCQVPHTAVHKPLQRVLDPQVLSLHAHSRPFHLVSSYGLFRR